MNAAFLIVTVLFMLVSLAMVLIILVQRPSGGGLAGAFGGAGGSGSDTVFGGRVGDALTWATVIAFVLYLGFAITLNLLDDMDPSGPTGTTPPAVLAPSGATTNQPLLDGTPLDDFSGFDDSNNPPITNTPPDDTPDSEPDSTTEDPENVDPPGGDN